MFTLQGLGDHNFCRNPDDDKQPWCWVKVGANNFGFCDVPECNKEPVTTTTGSLLLTYVKGSG